MGGLESLNATLSDPEAVSASVVIYGFGFDKIDTKQLEKLKSPVLVIAGGEDTGATQAAVHFLCTMKGANRLCEIFVYPGADHGYAQHYSTKEKISIHRLSAPHGSSSMILLRVICGPDV
jgi:dienelactone hydrolase